MIIINILMIICTLLITILGLNFMFTGIKNKNISLFYEGFVTMVVSIIITLIYFI